MSKFVIDVRVLYGGPVSSVMMFPVPWDQVKAVPTESNLVVPLATPGPVELQNTLYVGFAPTALDTAWNAQAGIEEYGHLLEWYRLVLTSAEEHSNGIRLYFAQWSTGTPEILLLSCLPLHYHEVSKNPREVVKCNDSTADLSLEVGKSFDVMVTTKGLATGVQKIGQIRLEESDFVQWKRVGLQSLATPLPAPLARSRQSVSGALAGTRSFVKHTIQWVLVSLFVLYPPNTLSMLLFWILRNSKEE